jgi:hypothetical protein
MAVPSCFRSFLFDDTDALLAVHHPQSSSASRLTAGAAGFLNLSQSGERPER